MKLLDQINNLNLSPQANKTLIEFFIERYKGVREEKEDLIEQNKDRAEKIKDIEQRLDNVSNLIKTQDRISREILRLGSMVGEGERESQVSSIKISRLNYVFQTLKRVKMKAYSKFSDTLQSNDRSFIVGRSVIFSIVVIFVFTIFLYLLKQDSQLLTLGFIGLSLNLISFVLINVFNNINVSMVEGLGINYGENDASAYESLITKLDMNQERFLVNAAWITALEKEKETVSNAIESKLEGVKYQELLSQKESLRNEIEANELALSKNTEAIITAEDYLSLRRELDILSIELEGEQIEDVVIQQELKNLHVKNVAKLSDSFRNLLTLAQAKFHFSVS